MDPAVWTTRAGGAARRSDFTRAGISWRRLAAAVSAGDLLDLGGGAFAVPGADAEVVAAVTRSASLSCVSALHRHGVDLLRAPARIHLSGPRDPPDGRVRWHRGPREDLTVGLARAAAQALVCCPAVDGLVAMDSLLRSDRAGIEGVRAELPRHAGGHARWVLDHATALAGSVLESALRYELVIAGIPHLIQAPIAGVGHVDFLIAGWLVVETDGWDSHGDQVSFEVDRHRDAAAATQGFRTLRFTWTTVRRSHADVLSSIRAVLASGPPSGAASVTNVGDLGPM